MQYYIEINVSVSRDDDNKIYQNIAWAKGKRIEYRVFLSFVCSEVIEIDGEDKQLKKVDKRDKKVADIGQNHIKDRQKTEYIYLSVYIPNSFANYGCCK